MAGRWVECKRECKANKWARLSLNSEPSLWRQMTLRQKTELRALKDKKGGKKERIGIGKWEKRHGARKCILTRVKQKKNRKEGTKKLPPSLSLSLSYNAFSKTWNWRPSFVQNGRKRFSQFSTLSPFTLSLRSSRLLSTSCYVFFVYSNQSIFLLVLFFICIVKYLFNPFLVVHGVWRGYKKKKG